MNPSPCADEVTVVLASQHQISALNCDVHLFFGNLAPLQNVQCQGMLQDEQISIHPLSGAGAAVVTYEYVVWTAVERR